MIGQSSVAASRGTDCNQRRFSGDCAGITWRWSTPEDSSAVMSHVARENCNIAVEVAPPLMQKVPSSNLCAKTGIAG